MIRQCRYFCLAVFLAGIFTLYYLQSQSDRSVENQSTSSIKSVIVNEDEPIKLLILVWTSIFGDQTLLLGPDCPLHERCELTYNHSKLPHASAVIFHVPDIKWVQQLNQRELNYDLPDLPDLPPGQQRVNVFFSHENPTMLARYYNSNGLARHDHNYFHWTMTYMHSSHVPMPYGGFWVPPEKTAQLGFPPTRLPNDRDSILGGKRVRGILWMVSNCDSYSKRELAIRELAKHIPITIGGKCAKTSEGRDLCPRSAPSCDHLFAQYFFYIAAENDNCRDYVTEKYWTKYQQPSVPIVMRKHIYERLMVPNNSYIAMDQFTGPKSMADHLKKLMDSPVDYLNYFQWRSKNWSIAPWNHEGYRIGQCGLCERLLRLANGKEQKPRPLPSAVRWFEQQSSCEGGQFAEQWAANGEKEEDHSKS